MPNINTPKQQNQQYTLTPEGVEWLKEKKLISEDHRIWFALLVTYGKLELILSADEVQDFCDEWSIEAKDFSSAIAKLHTKKVAKNEAPISLQLRLFPEEE